MKRFIGSHNYVCRLQNCLYVNRIEKNARTFTARTSNADEKCSDKFGNVSSPIFKPARAAILSRITRYEFEKLRYKGISEEGLKEKVDLHVHFRPVITRWSGSTSHMRVIGDARNANLLSRTRLVAVSVVFVLYGVFISL